MKQVIAGVADLRRKPQFRSERISQLVYGECVQVLGSEESYLRVKGIDGYEGFLQKSLVGSLDGGKVFKVSSKHLRNGLQLPFGSYLSEEEAKRYSFPAKHLQPVEKKFDPVKLASQFLGVPYLWGGTSEFGYDCSGFTQRLFRFSGTEIPRNASWQRDAGAKVKGFEQARKGDLVFFTGHVGLYLGNMTMVHSNLSHGGVSLTDLSDRSEYSQRLMSTFQGIRRLTD